MTASSERVPGEPLLALKSARIDVQGVVGEALTARGGSARLTLIGRFRPLFRLFARDATLAAGEALVAGKPAAGLAGTGGVGLALFAPTLPATWTAERYLLESARLLGLDEREARREADAAVARFELAPFAHRRLGDSSVSIQRVLLFAHATLGAPELLCVEAPLSDLDGDSRAYVAAALERAASGRRLIASVTSTLAAEERALVERADWVVVGDGERVVREGPPSRVLGASSRYAATVTRAGDAFLRALAERGVQATPLEIAPLSLGFAPRDGAGLCRVLLELPEGASPAEIVAMAHRADAPLVEFRALP